MPKRKTKRLVHARTPSGRISRAGEDKVPAPVAVKRLRDAALAGMRDAEWGSELGRLYLKGTITEGMYTAGKRWREWAKLWHNAIMVAPVRSATGERFGHAQPADPASDEGRKIARREADHAERFFAAHAVLVACGAESAVRSLCEHDEPLCGIDELTKARTGLMHLVSHWNLGK